MDTLHKWLGRIDREELLAVILGGSINGLCFGRSLGRRGIPTLMLDSRKNFGMNTRYGQTHVLPPIDGAYHVTVDAPGVAHLSRKLLAAFDYRGFAHVEFKFDQRDNSYRLMESMPAPDSLPSRGLPRASICRGSPIRILPATARNMWRQRLSSEA